MRCEMYWLVILAVLYVGIHATSSQSVHTTYLCPENFHSVGKKCYHFSTQEAKWTDAHFYCQVLNSSLAVINSYREQNLLKDFICGGNNTVEKTERWIDGIYDWKEKSWKWGSSGKQITFNAFSRKHLGDDYKWKCISLNGAKRNKWFAKKCTEDKSFICETDTNVVVQFNIYSKKNKRRFDISKCSSGERLENFENRKCLKMLGSIGKNDPENLVKKPKRKTKRRNVDGWICPPNMISLGNRCYFFSDKEATWEQAFFECRKNDSKLAIIRNRSQDHNLRRFLNNFINFQNDLFGNPQAAPSVALTVPANVHPPENAYTTVAPAQNPPLPVSAPAAAVAAAPLQTPSYGYGSGHVPLMPPPMPPFGKTEADYNAYSSYSTTATTAGFENSYSTTSTFDTSLGYPVAGGDKPPFPEESFEPPQGANPYPPSEEYNPEEDVATWEPDASWNGGAPVIPDTDTPESPPMFEKEGYSDPVEYHDTLVTSGAVDVDHRVVPGLSADLEDSMGSLGGKDVDHRNLISLTGSPGNSSSNNPSTPAAETAWNQTDQDYRIPPSGSAAPASASAGTADQDYRLGFNIEQLKLPPPPPPPPKTQEEVVVTAGRLPAPFPVETESALVAGRSYGAASRSPPPHRNESAEDMDMDMSDDEGRHKINVRIVVNVPNEQRYSLEPPPPLPNLPDDEDANNFLDDLSNDLHEFGNLSDDNSNTNTMMNHQQQQHHQNAEWGQAGPLLPPPMMSFNDMVGPPMMPPPQMNTMIPPPPRPGNMLMSPPPMMNPPPSMSHPHAMPLLPPPQPWMTEDEPNDTTGGPPMDNNDKPWMNDDFAGENNWDKPPKSDFAQDAGWGDAKQDFAHDFNPNWEERGDRLPLHGPNEWLGPPPHPMNNNAGPFRGRGNNRGNFVKRGRGRGGNFNRGGNFRGGDWGGPRGAGRGGSRGGAGGPNNRGFFPRGNFRGNYRGGF